jgi:pyruvate formate-lyase activating enzyme-like uncharacterized protein
MGKIIKSDFASCYLNGVPEGCKLCVRGKKLVLFLGGRCSRSCWYCSLGDKRKKCEKSFANEREIKVPRDLILEAKESKALGAGITGGDPLVYFDKLLKYSSALKKEFGTKFHIHVYLPLGLVDRQRIEKLSEYVDEFRFHPSFLMKEIDFSEVDKIKMVSKVVGKARVGLELPMLPGKRKEFLKFLKSVVSYISFLNLNEFEISETNFARVSKEYKMNNDSYSVKKSKKEGLRLMKKIARLYPSLKVHLCTARTKDAYQFRNRLKQYDVLPFGKKTDDGTAVYFVVYDNMKDLLKKFRKGVWFDKEKGRVLVSEKVVEKVKGAGFEVAREEEDPTVDRERVEFEKLE